MKIGTLNAQLAAIQLEQLFGIDPIFRRRGRRVTAYEETEKLLVQVQDERAVFAALHSPSFRRIVASIANNSEPVSAARVASWHTDLTANKIAQRLDEAVTLGMVGSTPDGYAPIAGKNFGATLEWYVAGLCTTELASIAFWGVTVEGIVGDYDVVVVRESQIGYIECKSGRVGNITDTDLDNFLEREQRLAPQFSVFLVDGVSRQRVGELALRAANLRPWTMYQLPMQNPSATMVLAEEYRSFVRLTPANIFFVAVPRSIAEALREVYEFLTLVCDRHLRLENIAATAQFRDAP